MNENNLILSWKKINTYIAGIFAVLILAVFPLAFRHFYFDILTAKYQYYYVGVITTAVVMIMVALFFLYRDKHEYGGENIKRIIRTFSIRKLKAADWAMLAFVLMATISTSQSEYLYESFWGNEGRLGGLFLLLIYGVSYIVIVGCLRFKRWYLDAFLTAGILACIIGILQYFKFNPFGMKTGLEGNSQWIFTSTIGNVNTYTSYLSLLLGVGVVLFVQENTRLRKIFYLVSASITMISLVMGISDNSYIALIVLMGLLPLYLFTDLRGGKQYALLLSVLLTILILVGWVNQAIPDHVIGIEGLFRVITGFRWLPFIAAMMWGLTCILYIADRKRDKPRSGKKCNTGRWIWLGILILAAVILCAVLYDVNIRGNIERYGSLENYLLFDDEWGTHRGYVWRIAIESYQRFPLHHKIFGYGPETFGIMTVQNYLAEMGGRYYEKFDNAHNEYIQYLFTIGIAGLTAYLTLLVTSLREILRNASKVPEIMGIAFALVCYWAQAAVNLSTPIVTPIMLALMMVGIAAGRRGESTTLLEGGTESGSVGKSMLDKDQRESDSGPRPEDAAAEKEEL